MSDLQKKERWYSGVTGYQWLVLLIASLGWIFDVYEGQIFNLTRNAMLSDILGLPGDSPEIKKYGELFLAIFLLGGTFGGLLFGSLADRHGRGKIMVITILMYSVFSGLTFFATELWHVASLRFFVAMGVGGEWAVAAALVAEVFPKRARAQASGIFHTSSVLGTTAAALVAMWVVEWRHAYLIGILPALLVVWVRISIKEPEQWKKKREEAKAGSGGERAGSFFDLLCKSPWNKKAFLGMGLAAVGLGTFWAITIAGQDIVREMQMANGVEEGVARKSGQFAYGVVQTIGGGFGLLLFGPLCAWIGRKKTFIFYHLAAVIIVPITCFVPQTYEQLLFVLPFFGFFTLGMHAGYAVYFPELFPTRLRATGTSFCFNGGRILAVTVLIFSGWLKSREGIELTTALTMLSGLFLVGAFLVLFLPETKGQDLPD
ncbi:MAG: MFS family permease [Verrucomicrobiales bacterium]|jgi:MFS family permease